MRIMDFKQITVGEAMALCQKCQARLHVSESITKRECEMCREKIPFSDSIPTEQEKRYDQHLLESVQRFMHSL